ncbi:MAG: aminopeptidase [Planctomycetes bacterium]|nr:aminopeptidase [Planctomycetota bacterium]NOG53254.1 aminopeptidase [Planctomycetota bacterium]
MRDPRLDKLADIMVHYSSEVKTGDLVCISADPIAMPMIEAVYEKTLQAGGHPFWIPRSEALADIFLEQASDEQLDFLSPLRMQMVEAIDVQIGLWADVNTRSSSRVDPARQSRLSRAGEPYFVRFLDRAAEGDLRWVGTQYPTQASAQDAEMSLRQYEEFVYGAGKLDLDDPAAAWRHLREQQKRACDWLNQKKEVRFRAPNGTDLTVNVDGATWINCAGEDNFPDGEVFAGPQGVEGVVYYTFPAVNMGREVTGIRLEFRNGIVVDASASKGEDFLIAMLDMDPGARHLGEIAIGTNYSITEYTRNTLFDEKIGGTFHAAVGQGYPESGSNNKSALHWDMVCDLRQGGTIEADGELFHENGHFKFEGWPGAIL